MMGWKMMNMYVSIQKYGDFLVSMLNFRLLTSDIPRVIYVSLEAQELDRGAPASNFGGV